MARFLPLEQQFVHPADSFQQHQDHDLDWTLEIGPEGGTGSVTVWDWDGSSLLILYSSGEKKKEYLETIIDYFRKWWKFKDIYKKCKHLGPSNYYVELRLVRHLIN